MSTTKHTPGPWVRGGGFGPRSTAVTTTSGRHIAAVETWGVKHPDERAKYEDLHVWWPEGEANLNLIAATPDLFAFARDYLASGDECVRGDDSCVESDSCGVCNLKRSAQAAIAKAEGRS